MIYQNINPKIAREKLGEISRKMSDKDIQEILNCLYFMCDQTVNGLWEKDSKELNK